MIRFFITVCHLLGDFMESVKKDFSKAAIIYKSNCDDYKFSRSCHKFAGYSFVGKGCQEDQEKSLEYFKKGCELGETDSCLNAGLLNIVDYSNSKIKKDFPQGFRFLAESCGRGSSYGCFYISGMYLTGVPDHLERNLEQAFQFGEKACHLGSVYACANVSRMYAKGDGVAADPAKSELYKKKAMEMANDLKGGTNIEFGKS